MSVPVIDLAAALSGDPAARLAAGRDMDRICREIGFFTVTGHGVPAATIATLREQANGFFGLPLTEKRRAVAPDPATPRGYRALGIEALSLGNEPGGNEPGGNEQATPPDLKEYYHLGREEWPHDDYHDGAVGRQNFIPNIWPERPAGLARAAEVYYAAMERLALAMMQLAALGLGLDEHFFDGKLDRHITAIRLNHYPVQETPPAAGQLRAGAHTDYGLLTILNGEDVPGGLQALTRDGRWVDVATDPASFVVNIGDLLMRWTNDRWMSNSHRVLNPPAEAARGRRLSIAYFTQPNYDAVIECIAPPGEAKYPPVVSGDYRAWKYAQTRVAA